MKRFCLLIHAKSDKALSSHPHHDGDFCACDCHSKLQSGLKPATVAISAPQLLPQRLSWGSELYLLVSMAVYLANFQETKQKMRKYQTVCFMLLLTQGNLS